MGEKSVQPTSDLSPQVGLERALEAFEKEWREGKRPDWKAFLPADPSLRAAAAKDLQKIDREYRTKAGEMIGKEEYSLPADPYAATYAAAEATQAPGARPPDSSLDLYDGSTLGAYRILEKLGEGGMGAVFKALHTKLNKQVAVKVLPFRLTADRKVVERFEREIKAVGALEHPHIVRAMDAGEAKGTHYLVMEYVAGQDLYHVVRERGTVSPREAARIIRDAALGLAHAHEHGLIHRDIKPSNLLLTPKGQVKILDLGLARLMGDKPDTQGPELTTAGQTFGTPDYMAPEQWEDAHSADARSDLYALGCTLYFLLVGHSPYGSETYTSLGQKMRGHLFDAVPDLKAAREDVPGGLVAIYQKLLAKKPDDRIQSAEELAQALEPYTVEQAAPVVIAEPTRKPAAKPKPPQKKTAVLLGIAGGLIGFVLAVGIVIKISNSDGTTTTLEVPDKVQKVEVLQGGKSVGSVRVPQNTDEPKPAASASSPMKPAASASLPTAWHGWPADAPPPAIAPFDAEQAQRHQAAWAKYLGVPVDFTNSLGMKFRLIPPGEFLMGATDAEVEERLAEVAKQDENAINSAKYSAPQRRVTLTRPFYAAELELTQSQYEQLMGTNPSHFSKAGEKKTSYEAGNYPVENVKWLDAVAAANKLNEKEGLPPFDAKVAAAPYAAVGYRLPTEAEWEYFCRAGTTTRFWSGDDEAALMKVAIFGKTSGGTPRDSTWLKKNPFGIRDVHGNVAEWCLDLFEPQPYPAEPVVNPLGVAKSVGDNWHVIRGGDWRLASSYCNSSARLGENRFTPFFISVGLRLVLSVEGYKQLNPAPQDGTSTKAAE